MDSLSIGDIIALIIIGALAGSAAARVLGNRSKKTSDALQNTVIGIVGAVVGSFVFRLLDLSLPDALEGSISLADVIVAFIGALLVIFIARMVNR